jgi:hypothetical protein
MTELAVKDYVMNQVIPNITIPSQVKFITTLKGYRQLPKIATLGTICAITIEEDIPGKERRMTSPRDEADKSITYMLPLTINAVGFDEQEHGDQFDVLVEAIAQAMRSANTSMFIADPITAEESVLHKIGENMDRKRYSVVQISQDGSEATLVKFKFLLVVEIIEWIQG